MIATMRDVKRPTAFSATTTESPSRASSIAPAWAALPGGIVDDSEIVLLAIKPSVWRPVFESGSWLAASCVLAIVLTWTGTPIPGMSLATTAQVVLILGLARLAIAIIRWVPMWHILTNRRIIDVSGVRSHAIKDCSLLAIRNTVLSSSWLEKLTGLGTISFVSDHPTEPLWTWRSIADPELIHAKIRRAIENAIDQHDLGT